ncbi:MAG: permease [Fidelibacterota bacterium]
MTARRFATEMFTILPAVLILMGLFAVWVSKETVMQYLGKSAGLKGIALALFFGALPTGPLYIAFPMAAGLRKKGASLTNVAIFLTAWACIKLPQELVELQFLGPRFMLARLSLTILAAVAMGLIIEKIATPGELPDKQPKENDQ